MPEVEHLGTIHQLSFCARCTNTNSEKKGAQKQHPQVQHKSCKLIVISKSAPLRSETNKELKLKKKKRTRERERDWICLRSPNEQYNSQKAYLRKAKGSKIHQKSKTRESSCMKKKLKAPTSPSTSKVHGCCVALKKPRWIATELVCGNTFCIGYWFQNFILYILNGMV